MKLDNYNGSTFYNTDLVPICPVNLASCTVENCKRRQVPLKLSWAVTIHKFQGLTIHNTFVDLGPTGKVADLANVALSRVNNLSDLMAEPTSFERLGSVKKSVNLKFRIIK